jgi:hypothetical protein
MPASRQAMAQAKERKFLSAIRLKYIPESAAGLHRSEAICARNDRGPDAGLAAGNDAGRERSGRRRGVARPWGLFGGLG